MQTQCNCGTILCYGVQAKGVCVCCALLPLQLHGMSGSASKVQPVPAVPPSLSSPKLESTCSSLDGRERVSVRRSVCHGQRGLAQAKAAVLD